MAKKDPTDLSVEERLKTLYQLQTSCRPRSLRLTRSVPSEVSCLWK